MTAPEGVERQRTAGWRMPPNTKSVTRPSIYGNPFFPGCGIGYGYIDDNLRMVDYDPNDPAQCVLMYRMRMRDMKLYEPEKYEAFLAPLRGKNLACWCKIGAPCHRDVLLELANVHP